MATQSVRIAASILAVVLVAPAAATEIIGPSAIHAVPASQEPTPKGSRPRESRSNRHRESPVDRWRDSQQHRRAIDYHRRASGIDNQRSRTDHNRVHRRPPIKEVELLDDNTTAAEVEEISVEISTIEEIEVTEAKRSLD